MARMTLLGVGTALPDPDRENTHMLWVGPGGPLLIDAGGSTYQRMLRAGYDPLHLSGVLVTHSHADHINGLPALLFQLGLRGRNTPLPIYGLDETLALVRRVIEAFTLEDYCVAIDWRPIAAGDTIPLSGETEHWQLRTALTLHSRPGLALRFERSAGDGSTLVYSGDTAPCAAVSELARGATVLVHEATTAEPSPFHTSPRQAAEIAQQAGVHRLVLVHFSPQWTMPNGQVFVEAHMGGFNGIVEVGLEYQVIEL